MRVPQWVNDFFDWRWAPCVGLTAGSLTFVALALLLIPSHFGGEPPVVTVSAYDTPRTQRAIFSSALARPEAATVERRFEASRPARAVPPAPRSGEVDTPRQRGFSPIIERPEPPPSPPAPAPVAAAPPVPAQVLSAQVAPAPAAPAPGAPATEAPAPAPGSVVVIQPEPGGPAREVTTQ